MFGGHLGIGGGGGRWVTKGHGARVPSAAFEADKRGGSDGGAWS